MTQHLKAIKIIALHTVDVTKVSEENGMTFISANH